MSGKKLVVRCALPSLVILLAVLTVACGAAVQSQEVAAGGSAALAETVPQFVGQLRAQGLAVKEGGTIPGNPKGLYVALQGATENEGAADFVGVQSTLRQAAIAKSRGLEIDSVQVEVFSSSGTMISGQRIPLTGSGWEVGPEWSSEPGVSDAEIETTVMQAVTTEAVSINRLQLTVDPAGYRTLVMQATASDNGKLAAGLNDIRSRITQAVNRLNETEEALIALVVIDIDSPEGNPLHRSSLDWQLKMEGYWNDPAVQALLPDGRLNPVGPGV